MNSLCSLKISKAKLVLSVLCLSALVGCLTVGDEFSSEVNWIQKDQTSRKQIEAKMGSPFRTGYDTGLLTYTYAFYRYSVFRPARTKDLTVRFNQNGTVQSYSFASSFDEDRAELMRK
jgi:outer membrane protein assembly factor BamE (lipoprotein component of BamABCDE complex)